MSHLFRELTIILALTLCGSTFSLLSGRMHVPWKEPQLQAGEIRLQDMRGLDVIWVDARSLADYEAGHIPNAVLLNNSNWDDSIYDLMELWLTNPQPIIVYCSSAQCNASKQIAEKLRADLPEAEVNTLKGGWEAWEK